MKNKVYVLMMMGGSGTRFGDEKPKQFSIINNLPIFIYPLKQYELMPEITGVVIVNNASFIEEANKYVKQAGLTKVLSIVSGGDIRSQSVLNGAKELVKYADDESVILIHDATHPFVDIKGTSELINLINEYGAGTMVNYIYDTAYIKTEDDFIKEVIDRKKIAVGASPEGFNFKLIKKIYFDTPKEELEKMTSAGALAVHFNVKMAVKEINLLNIKITYKRDFRLYKKLFDYYQAND